MLPLTFGFCPFGMWRLTTVETILCLTGEDITVAFGECVGWPFRCLDMRGDKASQLFLFSDCGGGDLRSNKLATFFMNCKTIDKRTAN